MIKLYQNNIGTAILRFEDGYPVAFMKDMIVDPDTGKIEAFWVKPTRHFLSYAIIQTQDIVEWKKNIYVKNEDVLVDPVDVIKISNILSQKREVIGNEVRTESGVSLGHVVDIDFDVQYYYLRNLYVQKRLLGLWSYQKRILNYETIIEIFPEYILVKDKKQVREKIAEALLKKADCAG
ncbi:hypothetical protein COY07_01195 [Candidatus Peregrinibacteria bacterium CG_4_10_14_0_2_um_filter_43_11]|nr:MAG: hypothetical protein COY07_01195 [Candidatus Peregrinibacteria bacterium CG_4_10_14_0_2_um_filter_43_11]